MDQEEVAPGGPDPPRKNTGIFDFAFCAGVMFCHAEEAKNDDGAPTRAPEPSAASRFPYRASRSRSHRRSCFPADLEFQAGLVQLYQDGSSGEMQRPPTDRCEFYIGTSESEEHMDKEPGLERNGNDEILAPGRDIHSQEEESNHNRGMAANTVSTKQLTTIEAREFHDKKMKLLQESEQVCTASSCFHQTRPYGCHEFTCLCVSLVGQDGGPPEGKTKS